MSLARMVAISRVSPSRVFAHADSSDSNVRVARAAHGGTPANRSKRAGRHGSDVKRREMVPGGGQAAFEVPVGAGRCHRAQQTQVLADPADCLLRFRVTGHGDADVDASGHGVEPILDATEKGTVCSRRTSRSGSAHRGRSPTIPR